LGSDSSPEDIRMTLTNLPDASQTYDPQTIRRIILIRRSTTGASMGFAFVEFEDMEVSSYVQVKIIIVLVFFLYTYLLCISFL
jgi:RNA recognition motif-containing protein